MATHSLSTTLLGSNGGAWQAYSPYDREESDTTELLTLSLSGD